MKNYAIFFGILFVLVFGISSFASQVFWEDLSRTNLGLRDRINFLLFSPDDENYLYAATGNGLFYGSGQGENWKRIFRGRNALEKECTALALSSDAIYLGTKAGLFISRDKGRSWHKETGKLGKSHILAIAQTPKEPDNIYVACTDAVFKTQNKGKNWENIFLVSPAGNNFGQEQEEGLEGQDEKSRVSEIRYITIDPNKLSYLYLATSRGVYLSQDKGKNWQPLTSLGLLKPDVRFLLVSCESRLYAVTKSGIFEYKDNRWQELSLGLAVNGIKSLALDKQRNLYAVCDKGLFKAKIEYVNNYVNNNDTSNNLISLYCKDEPTIKEVQQRAIEYAEVEPEKIILWRKQAAKKAWLPEVGMGINKDAADLWHWETGSTTRTDDDVLRRGRATVEWDVSLKWDLSEIIFNADQTSIDARSRLMVELRGDILDEVNRLYFERLRLKLELDNLSIEDRKKRLEKELRIEEVTAMLDGLTNGYFSQAVNAAKEEKSLQKNWLEYNIIK